MEGGITFRWWWLLGIPLVIPLGFAVIVGLFFAALFFGLILFVGWIVRMGSSAQELDQVFGNRSRRIEIR